MKQQTLFYQVSEVNVSGRKGGLYFLAEIFNGRIYSNVTVITVTRKFANYRNYSNVDVSAISTGVLKSKGTDIQSSSKAASNSDLQMGPH